MSARIEHRGDALIVWNVNAARRNALTPEYYAAVVEACERAAVPGIAAVVLTGEGDFFCAGGDLNTLITRRELSEAARRDKIEGLHGVIRAIRACPAPVIAAVEGGAAGAGVSIAFACDMVVAARQARFTMAYVKAGLAPDGGLTQTLARVIPPHLLARLMLLGESVDAERLHMIGALSEICADGDALDTALSLADRLGDGPQDTQRAIKRLLVQGRAATLDTQLDAERDAMARAQGGDEAGEGIAAFLDKRPPDFRKLRA
ncbi:enoyl-CoA hydratase/isomerase family protein [Maribius pontilimi]|uniref:Enoyl-CoA hydratase/isomerase family protein n=1 Tax=Palleronia pontilimi TaxID=1964209 RepID=A0A934IEJ6_9RHOB|nr:enoyl-CoA hydratase family protein [Palleronia pontilimi]MBJ3764181.1 enoyl-CoA hydratase/isomerase family protein [Palleronia pontilimi]